jgi:protein arginine phosphatase
VRKKKTIVFVCTGNTCRSPMAEHYLKKIMTGNVQKRYAAASAGINALNDEPASENAVETMNENFDIDISSHRSAALDEETISQAYLLLTMTKAQKSAVIAKFPEHEEKVMTLGEFADEPEREIPDPYGLDLAAYTNTAMLIAKLVEKINNKLDRGTRGFKKFFRGF